MKAQRKRQEERVHAPASLCVCVYIVCVLPQFVTIAMKMVARQEHDPWTAARWVYQYKHQGSYHTLIYTIHRMYA